MYVAPKVLLLE